MLRCISGLQTGMHHTFLCFLGFRFIFHPNLGGLRPCGILTESCAAPHCSDFRVCAPYGVSPYHGTLQEEAELPPGLPARQCSCGCDGCSLHTLRNTRRISLREGPPTPSPVTEPCQCFPRVAQCSLPSRVMSYQAWWHPKN